MNVEKAECRESARRRRPSRMTSRSHDGQTETNESENHCQLKTQKRRKAGAERRSEGRGGKGGSGKGIQGERGEKGAPGRRDAGEKKGRARASRGKSREKRGENAGKGGREGSERKNDAGEKRRRPKRDAGPKARAGRKEARPEGREGTPERRRGASGKGAEKTSRDAAGALSSVSPGEMTARLRHAQGALRRRRPYPGALICPAFPPRAKRGTHLSFQRRKLGASLLPLFSVPQKKGPGTHGRAFACQGPMGSPRREIAARKGQRSLWPATGCRAVGGLLRRRRAAFELPGRVRSPVVMFFRRQAGRRRAGLATARRVSGERRRPCNGVTPAEKNSPRPRPLPGRNFFRP